MREGLSSLNLPLQWIRGFPDVQKSAVMEAFDSASLAKTRRALRLLEELGPDQRGPVFEVEMLSTFNLEPLLPVLQLALNCLPSQARVRLSPPPQIYSSTSAP